MLAAFGTYGGRGMTNFGRYICQMTAQTTQAAQKSYPIAILLSTVQRKKCMASGKFLL